MSKDAVTKYFELLADVLTQNNLHDKARSISYMNETGLNLNTSHFSASVQKGSEIVPSMSSDEDTEQVEDYENECAGHLED
ncbi:hypothetical protein HHI36_014443 [Cryptolaemus montrouzieri]|uniref:Uncharacterized protein n=1 Tax=Cryptolaemus montrouzieri TaxID=559131 RepID=A0ABD2N2Q1_9CUCU